MNLSFRLFKSSTPEEKALRKALSNILGFTPGYMPYYVMALTHRSFAADNLNNERMEFLGDAFIGSIVGEYLFLKYPTQNEGYLTEMRSKIVSRQSLNNVAIKMGLKKLVRYNKQDRILGRSHIFGNAFEALVGAIYLDKGFETTSKFIKGKLIGTFLDIDELETTEYNFKNKLYTWAQKKSYHLDFNTIWERYEAGRKIFNVGIYVNNQLFISASGYSKKEASQLAAQKALETLETQPNLTFHTDDPFWEKEDNEAETNSVTVADTATDLMAEEEDAPAPDASGDETTTALEDAPQPAEDAPDGSADPETFTTDTDNQELPPDTDPAPPEDEEPNRSSTED